MPLCLCGEHWMRKIGLLGGSFDPIHNGHLCIAQQAAEEVGLEKVLLIPAGTPPHKDPSGLAPAPDRLIMARLACRNMRGLEVSDIEVRKDGPSYTIDTFKDLSRALGGDVRLCLIIGEDTVGELPTWKDAKKLIDEAEFIVVQRPGFPRADFEDLARELGREAAEKLKASVVKIREPADVSSTEIRERIGRGESISGLVRAGVERYIEERGLYGK